MRKVKVVTAAEAAQQVKDGDTVGVSGFVGNCIPEALERALEKRFLDTAAPKSLTLVYGAAHGAGGEPRAADRFAHVGMTKRVVSAHYNLSPKLGKLIMDNEIEGYCFPQGVMCHLMRDIAAHRPGAITHVGLGTFCDPRLEGGKINQKTKDDLVVLVNILGEEKLLYKSFPINVAFIRGTYADESGNITMEKESCLPEVQAMAQACKNSGGKVFVQVERVVAKGTLDPKLVQIPGIYVEAVIVTEDPRDHEQVLGKPGYDPALCGEIYLPMDKPVKQVPLDPKKIIGRRAAMELKENTIVNLGIGAPEYVSLVAEEEGMGDYMTLTVEAGPVGGLPQPGAAFGSSANADAILPEPAQFDFYDGGGLDLAFLGLAQADESGNINVSKFGPRLAGCGGFIDITQNAKKVFFLGTFTAGGLKVKTGDGKLAVETEGKEKKFVKSLDQITFSGDYAKKTKQPVMYITERAVFELRADGLYLTEVAPGVDVQKDVLDLMEFKPKIDGPRLMDARIFTDKPMGLKG